MGEGERGEGERGREWIQRRKFHHIGFIYVHVHVFAKSTNSGEIVPPRSFMYLNSNYSHSHVGSELLHSPVSVQVRDTDSGGMSTYPSRHE